MIDMKKKKAFLFLIQIWVSLAFFLYSGCDKVTYETKKFFDIGTGTHHHIDVFVDVSGSKDWHTELGRDSLLVAELIGQLQTNDLLDVYFIHARTFTRAERIFQAGMPEKPGPREMELKKSREQALESFGGTWNNKLKEVVDKKLQTSSDILGVFLFLKDHTVKSLEHKAIILSDMLAVRLGKGGWNFERTAPAPSLLTRWKQEELVPELPQKNFYVFGCAPLANMSDAHYLQVRRFWEDYFELTRGHLVCYQYQRDALLLNMQ